MASAAEQMAANLSWGTFGKAKDLQSRILFALGLLIVYRIGTYVPVPGVDAARLREFFDQQAAGLGGMLNMFTGGAVGRMAIFSLGIMPYISASIIVQLLASMVPSLQALKKEGESGARRSTSTPATVPSSSPPSRPTASRSASRPRAWRTTRAGSSASASSSRWSAAPCS